MRILLLFFEQKNQTFVTPPTVLPSKRGGKGKGKGRERERKLGREGGGRGERRGTGASSASTASVKKSIFLKSNPVF